MKSFRGACFFSALGGTSSAQFLKRNCCSFMVGQWPFHGSTFSHVDMNGAHITALLITKYADSKNFEKNFESADGDTTFRCIAMACEAADAQSAGLRDDPTKGRFLALSQYVGASRAGRFSAALKGNRDGRQL